MPPGTLRTALAAVGLVAGLVAAARPVGPLPALGPFLDPAAGVWAGARADTLATGAGQGSALQVPGLEGAVRVVYDARRVPHIFADHEADAYRALGYVVARDRLFQLYAQTMAASGRLTEMAGPRAMPLDREMRRLGLPRAAERRLATMAGDTAAMRVLRAYADGINAWVDGLDAAAVPLEFKLLGITPPRWEPIHSLHMFGRMGYTLANIAPELDRLEAAARVGQAAAASLFPEHPPLVEPIQPNGQTAPRLDPHPIAPPGAPDTLAARLVAVLGDALPARAADLARRRDEALVEGQHFRASNNWAVAPARTAAGHPLLAGDPHLELTLPSIWYEAHLVVPGRLDVYGVTIPGLPGIVIGFNRDVAWTFTNTGADVMDFWAETVDDPARPTRYQVDGRWRPLEVRVETYRGRGGEIVGADTVRYTHRGPMRRDGAGPSARWLSMRWTVLEPTQEVATFPQVARARTATEWLDRAATLYSAPAQNMLVADRGGTIAIRSTGRFPIRAGTARTAGASDSASAGGRGDTVHDGRASASDWQGWLPVARWPQAVNPAQGFLASANQSPFDPRQAPGYFGGSYDPWRALRINALLRAATAVTPDSMRRWQADPGSARADAFVPHLLRVAAAPPPGADARRLAEAGRLLGAWDRRYTLENQGAVLFEWTMRELIRGAWDEFEGDSVRASRDPLGQPSRARPLLVAPPTHTLYALLADSANAWWDRRATAGRVERRDEVVAAALVAALDSCTRRYGPPGAGWAWNRHRRATVRHLLGLPALSARDLAVPGGPGVLWPSTGDGGHGPSWRMVVELGPEVRAWGTYPGGQSGDPSSPDYRDRLPRWLSAELDPLVFPRRPDDVPSPTGTLTLAPAAGAPAGGRAGGR